MSEIHSCSYYCDRPECIKAQRDELRDKIAPMPEPVGYGNAENIKNSARDGVPIVAWFHPGQSLQGGQWVQFDVPLYTVPPDQSARIAELETNLSDQLQRNADLEVENVANKLPP